MANFTPNGIISIGRVPFDNSYRHTMTFASRQAQSEYFASVCPKKLSGGDYTYVRMNNAIKVPYNAEELYTYNYVMYQNSNYGSKWFYAFIVGINYINKNTTELVLQLDVMQTWYFDYKLSQCFVEREHVSDDGLYKHTNPEPTMALEYQSANYAEKIMNQGWLVVQTTAYPHYIGVDTKTVTGSDAVTGGIYDGQYSAAKYIVFSTDSKGLKAAKRFMKNINEAGAADAISNIFTVPDDVLGAVDLEPLEYYGQGTIPPDTYMLKERKDAKSSLYGIVQDRKFGNFTPHNNKLYVYPYSFAEVGDFTGRKQDFMFEKSTYSGDQHYIQLNLKAPVNSEMQAIIRAVDYGGESMSKEVLTVNLSNKCPWTYSAYQNWAAQNSLALAVSLLGSLGGAAITMMPGISESFGLLGAGTGVQAAGDLMSTVASVDRMRRTPNESRGNINGNSLLGSETYGFYTANEQIREEYARIVDGFFDMYGYQVDRVKVPNRTGRPSWNYVKTRNACHHGNVPASDMALINSIFDNGITFWHTADVGNYSLANK